MFELLLYGQQLSLPAFVDLPLALIVPVLAFFVSIVDRRSVSIELAALFVIMCGVTIGAVNIFLFGSGRISSWIYFAALYLIYSTDLLAKEDVRRGQSILNTFGIICAALGLIQFAMQIVGLLYLDVSALVPSSVALAGYNNHYPVVYDSPIDKSNGFFCLEPSFFSQFIALALIVEFQNSKRIMVIILLLAGYSTSHSGTGILLLGFGTVGYVLQQVLSRGFSVELIQRSIVGVVLVFALLSLLAVFEIDFLGRAAEFTDQGSSGNIRFVAPYILLAEEFDSAPWALLFHGLGPGQTDLLLRTIDANFPSFVKVAIEYGLLYAVVFSLFMVMTIGRGQAMAIRFALIGFYFFANGAFLQPLTIFVISSMGCKRAAHSSSFAKNPEFDGVRP